MACDLSDCGAEGTVSGLGKGLVWEWGWKSVSISVFFNVEAGGGKHGYTGSDQIQLQQTRLDGISAAPADG